MDETEFRSLRKKMVSEQIFKRGISQPEVLAALENVPRHLFVPAHQRELSYADCPLPIGEGQTISQPYIVALMAQVLDIETGMSVLEIGIGSGYQAAVLSFLGAKVWGVERIPSLAERAKLLLGSLGYKAQIKVADGTLGWPEYAPYDRIIVTAAAAQIPPPLVEQLKEPGRLVIPLGGFGQQDLTLVHKISRDKIEEEVICGCVFVPLIGKYGHNE